MESLSIYMQTYNVSIYMCLLADKGPSIHLQYCQCVLCAFRSERHHGRGLAFIKVDHCLRGTAPCSYLHGAVCMAPLPVHILIIKGSAMVASSETPSQPQALTMSPSTARNLPCQPGKTRSCEHTMPNKSNPHL